MATFARTGELNRRITIQGIVRTEVPGGGWEEAPSDIDTVWAKVEPLQGRELSQFMQAGMAAPHRFTIRYRDDVSGATRVLYDGRTFNVTSVSDTDAKHRELVILADEVR